MRLEINSRGERTVVCMGNEAKCHSCGEEDILKLHFCEQDKELYCIYCLIHGRGCKSYETHLDYKLDKIEIIK